MMKRAIIFSLLIFSGLFATAQRGSGFGYGIQGSLLLNSATLPDIELNTNINSILTGDNLVKGKANYADLTFNYRFGGFVEYDHGFGFGLLEVNYTTAKINKNINVSASGFWGSSEIDLYTLERTLTYLDIALSYNIYLSNNLFLTLGITPGLLLSYTGNQKPNDFDFRVLMGFGYKIGDKISISTRAEFGITEVYKDSYIHHIMIPVTLSYTF